MPNLPAIITRIIKLRKYTMIAERTSAEVMPKPAIDIRIKKSTPILITAFMWLLGVVLFRKIIVTTIWPSKNTKGEAVRRRIKVKPAFEKKLSTRKLIIDNIE